MKYSILLVILGFSLNIKSQTSEENSVKNTIETFFNGFHKQDSLVMKAVVSKEIILQTIGKDQEGKVNVRTDEFENFLKSITAIPKDQTFEEKLLDFTIQIDGNMAHVWTPYEFWFNGKFSHCGVNSFQLVQFDGQWKIVYLIDTRRKEGCHN